MIREMNTCSVSGLNSSQNKGSAQLKKSYEHTQIGYLTITAIGAALLYMIYLAVISEFDWVTLIILLILGISLLIFATLRVTISADFLEIRFGTGIIRKRILLKDIQSAEVIQYPWYNGWGLRISLRGEWIYSVSGLRALKILTKSGGKYIIGTDDPEELASAIRKSMNSRDQ